MGQRGGGEAVSLYSQKKRALDSGEICRAWCDALYAEQAEPRTVQLWDMQSDMLKSKQSRVLFSCEICRAICWRASSAAHCSVVIYAERYAEKQAEPRTVQLWDIQSNMLKSKQRRALFSCEICRAKNKQSRPMFSCEICRAKNKQSRALFSCDICRAAQCYGICKAVNTRGRHTVAESITLWVYSLCVQILQFSVLNSYLWLQVLQCMIVWLKKKK